MDTRDSKSLRQEADGWMKQLDELNRDLDTRHDVQYGYLKEVVGQILKKTKDRASALLHELNYHRDAAKAQVAELQRKLANGKRHGFESKEAFGTLVDEIRKSVGEIPIDMMSLDPSAVYSAVESFQPTFSKYRPLPASVTAEVSLAAGLELQCRADAAITESAEFWAQLAPSAEVERELFNVSLSCRLRHLAVGQNASFVVRRDDVKAGLHCWAILDGVYYRAVVENIREGLNRLPVEIRAMDFGLCDAVRYEDLVPFAEHDNLIPYQAVRFRLYGKFPTKLPRQARWAFADAVKDKWLTVKLHSPQTTSDTEYPLWEVTLTTDATSGATINDAVLEKAFCTTAAPKVHASSDIRLLDPETAAAAGIQKVITVLNKKEPPTTGEPSENDTLQEMGIVSDMPLPYLDAADSDASTESAAAIELAGAKASSNSAAPSEETGVCTIAARSTSQEGVMAAASYPASDATASYPASGDESSRPTGDVPAPASDRVVTRGDLASGISFMQPVGSLTVGGSDCVVVDRGDSALRSNLTSSRLSANFGPSEAEQKSDERRNRQWADRRSSLLPEVTSDSSRLLGAYDVTAAAAVAGAVAAAAAEPALATQPTERPHPTNAEDCKPIAVLAAQPPANMLSAGRVNASFGHHSDDSHAAGEQSGKWRGKKRATDRRPLPQDFTSSSPSRSWTAHRKSRDSLHAAVVVSAFGDAAAESSADATNLDGVSSADSRARRSHPARDEGHPAGHFRPAKGHQAAGQRSAGGKWRDRKWTEGGKLPSYSADRYRTSDAPEVPGVTDTTAGISVAVAATVAAADAHAAGEAGIGPAGAVPAELQGHLPTMEQCGSSGGDSCPPVEHSCSDRGKAAAISEGKTLKAGGRTRPKISGNSKAALQALLQPGLRRQRAKKTGANDSGSQDGSLTTDS